MQGTVKWFDEVKEFGFIAAADGSADLLVEADDIAEEFRHLMREGFLVDFRIVVGPKGPQARRVEPVEEQEDSAAPQAADEQAARCA
ncbi:cold-shock protein [Nocardia takedensis]|uniref:cold-shock protein n=1 Tax=Nocardia takedensis TaxID=259390 RepID=UPI0002E6AB15|nr:cold shock domain-containing protein [Nocardia takedensis]